MNTSVVCSTAYSGRRPANPIRKPAASRIFTESRGQILPWMALLMAIFFGLAALVVDVGHAMLVYRELQAAADSAALAAAEQLPETTYSAYGQTFSASSGNLNAYNNLQNVQTTVTAKCLTTLKTWGEACVAPAYANAAVVQETVTIPTYFASVIGIPRMTLNATATAAMRGATPIPANLVIILDTTNSMSTSTDSNCNDPSLGSSPTRLQCAMAGVQKLLDSLAPCPFTTSSAGCTISGGQAANSVDRVNLMTFPNITVGTASDDTNCSGTTPSIPPYSLPPTTATTYDPTGNNTATYSVTGWLSDYRTSDSSGLNVNSGVVDAVGGGGTNCSGMAAPGGDGTYYAGVLYAAQAALLAEQGDFPNSQNVIVMLSDGEAQASSSKMASQTTDGSSTLSTSNTWTSPTNYPSSFDQCQQAIAAAQAIAATGTKIYSVAYGSEASGCTTDQSGPQAGITPCETMQQIASSPDYFYSDYNQSGSGSTCQSASQSATNLSDIFSNIGWSLTNSRLIPNNTP